MTSTSFGGMSPTPNCFALVQGSSEGPTRLNAFDHSLLKAGVGDTNLMRVSSILPPGAVRTESSGLQLPKGGLIPIAYAVIDSTVPGDTISAAVAVGIPEDPSEPGVIMEFEDTDSLDKVESIVRRMVVDAFEVRGRGLKEVLSIGAEHHVIKTGAVFAGVVLWYR